MADMPKVSTGGRITIGKEGRADTVVCNGFNELSPLGRNIEAVYLDRKRAFNKQAKWTGTHWDFSNPCTRAEELLYKLTYRLDIEYKELVELLLNLAGDG